MSAFRLAPVESDPFEHVVAEDWLEADLYAALRTSFPHCPPASGPTGHTLFPGDRDYDRLIEGNPAWRAFVARFQGQAFVDFALAQFRPVFEKEATVDLSRAGYVSYIESRADKESERLARIEHAPDRLWVRVDIMQGRTGYARAPHLDHRRRAATLLLYFSDAAEDGMAGGELVLHGADGARRVVTPRHNLMAMFPCHNRSLHSVAPILAQSRPRNFVQVTLSSSTDLWPPVRKRAVERLRALSRRTAGALSPR